jgi:hypothetical protein
MQTHLQDLIALGKEAGIDVHTLINRNKLQHIDEFPQALDRYDLRRYEFAEWAFDVHRRRIVPPECGAYESCFSL